VLTAYLINVVSEEIRASFLAWSQLAWTLAYAGSIFVAGYLWNDDYTQAAPFYYCGALYVVGTLLFFAYFRNVKEPHEHKTTV